MYKSVTVRALYCSYRSLRFSGVILVLTVYKSVTVRALYCSLRDGHVPAEGVFFAGVGRDHSDRGLLEMVKYLVNYCFYKFGVEVGSCLIGRRIWDNLATHAGVDETEKKT